MITSTCGGIYIQRRGEKKEKHFWQEVNKVFCVRRKTTVAEFAVQLLLAVRSEVIVLNLKVFPTLYHTLSHPFAPSFFLSFSFEKSLQNWLFTNL